MLKRTLRKLVRSVAGLPVIGRLTRIGVAVIRLPQDRDAYREWHHRQHIFESQQLPTLLQTLSDINHRQLTSDSARDNFVLSVPIALRQLTRDLVDLRAQVQLATDTLDKLSIRSEFVRSELMFEMRYGATRSAPASTEAHVETKTTILNTEKLDQAKQGDLRINLGCGHIPVDGYLNVDRRPLPGVDIVAEVTALPFKSGEVDEISSAHLLEHFPQEQLRRELLPYFRDLLKEGGVFRSVVPDAQAMLDAYMKGEYPYDDMREVIYGAQDYDGDFHFNMFTPEHFQRLLSEAGFSDLNVVAAGRKNGKCFEFEIIAKKRSNAKPITSEAHSPE